jgi:hypothetical protein
MSIPIGALIFAGLLSACSKPTELAASEIYGTYASNVDCGSERVVLGADGRYEMTFTAPSGRVRKHSGNWKRVNGGWSIEFEDFIFGYKATRECPQSGLVLQTTGGTWTPELDRDWRGRVYLEIDADIGARYIRLPE